VGTEDISVSVGGRLWQLKRTGNLEDLWENMLNDPHDFEDERLPYWTELWPSGVALARWLATRKKQIANQRCLDLGCGLGFTALVGQWLGARVVAVDYEEDALRFAAQNANINQVTQPLWTLMDWRRPAVRFQSMDRIWGGDIMYEKRFVAPVLRFLRHALAPRGLVWLAEPGRGIYDAFLRACHNEGWQKQCVRTESVEPFHAQAGTATVKIWELQKYE
jgi:predicted nicotinamide N-methyase